MEKLNSTYEKLKEWYRTFDEVANAKMILQKLGIDNQHSSEFISFFTPTDKEKLEEVLKLESSVKANRAYLISRAEDRVTQAESTQPSLVKSIEEFYAPRRIKLDTKDTKDTPYFKMIKDKSFWGEDNYAIEIPLTLPEACEKRDSKGRTWEEQVDTRAFSSSKYGFVPDDDLAFANVPKSEWRNLEKLRESYLKLETRYACAVWPSSGYDGDSISQVVHDYNDGMVCAIREGEGIWTTHLVAEERRDFIRGLGHILGKNIEDYKQDWEKKELKK
jgi:hypothetical protein